MFNFRKKNKKNCSDEATEATLKASQHIKNVIIDSGLWNEKFYLLQIQNNSHLTQALAKYDTVLDHYLLLGNSHDIRGSSFFDETYYLLHNLDVKELQINPLYHYIQYGEAEGRKPNPYFCPKSYLELNPDLAKQDICLLTHYSYYGLVENRRKEKNTPIYTKRDFNNSGNTGLAKFNFYSDRQIKSKNRNPTKVLAYYLPQYHPFEQNDEWWGKSFTEWTNVTKAKPLIENHEHPRLPTDLGFYDLRLKENIIAQAQMAKKSGISGFCMYYYWFNGTILMETPIELIYNNPEIDIEYSICWANENWTRTWDGQDKEVLISQTYSDEDDIAFISHVSKYFKDKRYTKVNEKPLLIIYRPSNFPNMKLTLDRWRQWSSSNGYGELHICMVQFDDTDPTKYGFDAAVEFPPHVIASGNIASHLSFDCNFSGSVHDYSAMINNSLNKEDNGYTVYKGVTMAWDNTARRGERASFFSNVSDGKFSKWLHGIEQLYKKNNVKDSDRIIMINAWNEWAEGTYLEPDRHHGYSYLNALSDFKTKSLDLPKIALLVHIFYDDLVDEIISYAKNISKDFDILITCVSSCYQTVSKKFNEEFPNHIIDIRVVPNKGRDIGPFLCNHVKTYQRYDYICKIHSKKSLHADGINNWRGFLYTHLLGSPKQVQSILNAFEEDETLGIQYPDYSEAIKPFIEWGSNFEASKEFLNSFGQECPNDLPDFPAGSMFWFRPEALKKLFDNDWKLDDFPVENGQVDNTIMHVIERTFLLLTEYKNKKIKGIE